MELSIRKFDPSGMRSHPFCLLVGEKNSGKTTFARDVLLPSIESTKTFVSSFRHQNEGRDEYENADFQYFKYPDPDPENTTLSDIVTEQVERDSARENAVVVMEDVLHTVNWFKEINIRTLMMNHRFLQTSVVMMMQYPIGFPVYLKLNIDYIFIFRHSSKSSRKEIYREFSLPFASFEEFDAVCDDIKPHACLAIDYTVNTNKMEDVMFWYSPKSRHGSIETSEISAEDETNEISAEDETNEISAEDETNEISAEDDGDSEEKKSGYLASIWRWMSGKRQMKNER
nr:hypothetical protein TetV2_00236 [Oceanusvirus sp.]